MLKNFISQFAYEPIISSFTKSAEGKENVSFEKYNRFVVLGMGGSHLSAGLLKIYNPDLNLIIHSDYGLPNLPENELNELKETLIIASSYSGNTEEVINGLDTALLKNLSLAVITTGGKLLDLAKNNKIPYIQIPNTGIESRFAIGFQIKALLKIIGDENALDKITKLQNTININALKEKGKELAEKIKGYIPVIYSSNQNQALAYFWKINFNETAKIPAFYNVFPELNHNEIECFNSEFSKNAENNKFAANNLSFAAPQNKFAAFSTLYFIFLKDLSDNPEIIKRIELTEKIYRENEAKTELIVLGESNIFEKIFSAVFLSNFTSYYLALEYKTNPEKTLLIDKFKEKLNNE